MKIFTKGIACFIIFLFVLMSVVPSTAVRVEDEKQLSFDGNILYVGGSGPNNYTTIQSAINDAFDGDTVFVYAGEYLEPGLFIHKSISLIGEDKETTIINAGKLDSNLYLCEDNCVISGFSLVNCKISGNDYSNAIIKIYSDDNTISGNILSCWDIEWNGYIAPIDIINASYNKILNNHISEIETTGRTAGIFIREGSSYNLISGNDISGYSDGICTIRDLRDDNDGGSDNVISDNYIHHNSFGIDIGDDNDEIVNNIINYNKYEGLDIHYGGHLIKGNIISYNGLGSTGQFNCGIMVNGMMTDANVITENHISNNKPTGLYIINTYHNVISRNNFIDNGEDDDDLPKYWANAYFHFPSIIHYILNRNAWRRNYWSDCDNSIYIISGDMIFFFPFGEIDWFNFDWHPASEPYDIE